MDFPFKWLRIKRSWLDKHNSFIEHSTSNTHSHHDILMKISCLLSPWNLKAKADTKPFWLMHDIAGGLCYTSFPCISELLWSLDPVMQLAELGPPRGYLHRNMVCIPNLTSISVLDGFNVTTFNRANCQYVAILTALFPYSTYNNALIRLICWEWFVDWHKMGKEHITFRGPRSEFLKADRAHPQQSEKFHKLPDCILLSS